MGVFSQLFGNKKKYDSFADLGLLGCDMHSHFIPAIDDGSKSVDETMAMLQSLADLGITQFITTPHIMGDFYQNSPETILPGLEKIRAAIKEAGHNWKIKAAAEYYMDHEFLSKLDSGPLMTVSKNKVLVEFSYVNRPNNMKDMLFALKINCYQPIVAHPERYPYLYTSMKEYEELLDFQVEFQLNLGSITGMYSLGAQKIALELMKRQWVTYVGTDMHNMKNYPFYEALLDHPDFIELVHSGKLKNAELFKD
jgi:tyrosine-protein phosphatase YwqE